MNIAIIGTRGWSYAGMEDLVRELAPRFVRDGHQVVIHGWATEKTIEKGITSDVIQNGVRRIFHATTKGKFTGQLVVAIRSTIAAALSDVDVIYCAFIQNGIYMWLPRLFGKRILSNVDGMMWRDPKWPRGFRHVFFPVGAYLTCLFSNKVITDSFHMQALYKRKFGLDLDWVGYGCVDTKPERKDVELERKYPEGYYLIMSRVTPHNLTDLMVEGFLKSKSRRHLLVAGHLPDSKWFRSLEETAKGKNVTFLGLVRDQELLTQIILHSKAYFHGHSLGGINPALVRVVGLDVPTICVDTVFNREVVEQPNKKLQACMFQKKPDSFAEAVKSFEANEGFYVAEAFGLGKTVRISMSWEEIYKKYKGLLEQCIA